MRSLLQNSLSKKAAALLVAAICLFNSNAFAQLTFTAVGGNWETNGSWTNSSGNNSIKFPRATDIAIIPTNVSITIPSGTNAVCQALTIEGALSNSGTLNLGNGVSSLIGTLTNNGTVTLAALGSFSSNKALNGNYNLNATSTVIFSGISGFNLPNLAYGNLEILNSGGINLTSALSSTNLKGYLTIRGTGKLYNKGFNIDVATSGKAFTMDSDAQLFLDGTTTLANVTSAAMQNIAPSSTITYVPTNTSTTISGGTYGKLAIEGSSIKDLAGNITLTGDATTTTSLTLSGNLTLSGGSFLLGDKNLVVTSTGIIYGASTTNYIKLGTGVLTIANIGTSQKVFPIGTATSYTPALISNSGNVQDFTIGLKDAITMDNGVVLNTNVVNRMWDVTPSSSGAIVDLTVQWNASDEAYFGPNDPGNFNNYSCAINHFNSNTGKWDVRPVAFGPAGNQGPAFRLTRTGITSFSPFAVGDMNSPLPVELISFSAAKKTGEVALTWETASEKNNTGFEVQASVDGKNYEALGFVASKNGNASFSQRYAFNHKTDNKEGLIYYRLKQIDMDGTVEYYIAKVVDLGRFAATASTFPNPFQNRFELNLASTTAETAQIVITDMTGKTVYQTTQKLQKGANTLNVELNNHPAGLYLIKATTGNQTYTNRLVKQ